LKTSGVVRHGSAAVRADNFQRRKILEHARTGERHDGDRFFVDKMGRITVANRAAARAVNVARHVKLDELLVERIPVFVAERRDVVVRRLARVGIQQAADESESLHAAVEFGDAILRARVGRLRQAANALESVRKKPALLRDQVVALLDEPLRNFRRLFRVHHLVRTRRKQLQVRADFLQQFQMRFAGVECGLVQERDHLVVADFHFSASVGAAMREDVGLVDVERVRRGQMAVDIDYHCIPPP